MGDIYALFSKANYQLDLLFGEFKGIAQGIYIYIYIFMCRKYKEEEEFYICNGERDGKKFSKEDEYFHELSNEER